jgi:transcriptional regulator GlxA family with amidase domain
MNAPFGSHAANLIASHDLRQPVDRPLDIAVLVLPGFSHLALHAYIEPFRIANLLSQVPLFRWRITGLKDQAVVGANGISIPVDVTIDALRARGPVGFELNRLAIVAGEPVERQLTPELHWLLRSSSRCGIPISAVGTATWLLAQTGLLADRPCTIHWSKLAAFSEVFRKPCIRDSLFVNDGRYSTCAGELAAFDLAVDLIGSYAGADIAQEVCRYATVEGQRSGSNRQAAPSGLAFGGVSDKLVKALRVMEENVEYPLSMNDVARLAGVSRRQLERLFSRYIGAPPVQHYLKVRLDHAKRLVEGTRMPIIDIAIACGFISASHFAKCFKTMHGMSPQQCRTTVPAWVGPGLG